MLGIWYKKKSLGNLMNEYRIGVFKSINTTFFKKLINTKYIFQIIIYTARFVIDRDRVRNISIF